MATKEDKDFGENRAPRESMGKSETGGSKSIAEHTVAADETLSHIALKYYGSAAKDYYMVIYEANKSVIGDNPNVIRPGMVLTIPELPADLKKE